MKIALIFPPFYLEPMYNLPPLGLINLATEVKDLPVVTVIIDLVLAIRQGTLPMGRGIYDDCAEIILAEAPDLVGLSAQCATYPAVIQIAKRIKGRAPHVKVVMGGHNASFLDLETLERFPFVDAVVRGEGEITFRDLVTACHEERGWEDIPGLTYRDGPHVIRNPDRELIADLNSLNPPDYRFSDPLSRYRDACGLPRGIAILEVGRGCPHRCVYCSESILWRRRTRTFHPSRLVYEMEDLHKNHGADCFLLAYDQFTSNRSFVESFCRRVIEKGLNRLPWYCISRLDSVDPSLLALMREAGCESMCYGVDSASERTLEFIGKNIDRSILYERVAETADQGIVPTLSFVIGFPEEKREDIDETLLLALRSGVVGNSNPLIQLPTVLPGTELYARYRESLTREADTYFALGLEFDGGRRLSSDEGLINGDPAIFSSFYNLPCPGLSIRKLDLIARFFPIMVRLYPKTFLLLALEYGEPASLLFISWMKWINHRLGRETVDLTPRDCYLHFRDFVSEQMAERGEPERKYLPEILRYEDLAIEAGRLTAKVRPFRVDLHGMDRLRPLAREGALVEAFDFDLPMIILDMKEGKFNKQYQPRRTVLVFVQEADILEVYEIDPLVKDFLESCDGRTDLDAILGRLFTRHGGDMDRDEFFSSCVEGIKSLGEMGLIGDKP